MLDFLKISTRSTKRGFEVYPKFIIGKSNDLMIRGGDFYAIWNESTKLWSTDEQDAISLIDAEIDKFIEEHKSRLDGHVFAMYMWDSDTGTIDKWHKYCQKQCRDSFHMLDEKLIFSNTELKKRDYASKRLEYPLQEGSIDAYDELVSVLYSEEERHKIEWAIGAVISGDSKKIQKFLVFYGAAGTGKSTVLNIIQQLFEGYYSVFDAKALGQSSNSFALEAFKSNPLVAIQHDGDLSKIEDNTRLNSLVSHELMTVNEKFKSAYSNRFKAFLFMGTNKPVKFTDAKSGLTRRLIDVSPTGNKVDGRRYKSLVKQINFELGAIAKHCLDVYEAEPDAFDGYIATNMMGATNDFYNYVMDSYDVFKANEGVTLKTAWEMYKAYCDEARVPYPMSQRNFKEELKNYFEDFKERCSVFEGEEEIRVRNYYIGFLPNKFEAFSGKETKVEKPKNWIVLKEQDSLFDKSCIDCPAQYASSKETPSKKWENVKETLKDVNTKELHYVRVPENHIVIDFDLKDSNGNKSLELNLEAASKWPKTYAEVSKGGQGLHLHYIYTGDDVEKLAPIYEKDIEVKVFRGNSSLRRRLSLCNNIDISNLSSGLPIRKEKKVAIDVSKSANEKRQAIVTTIERAIERDMNGNVVNYHGSTASNVSLIKKTLDDAYADETFTYDVSEYRNAVLAFASASTNQANNCLKMVQEMHFRSKEVGEPVSPEDDTIYFFDIEVYPNLFLIVYKAEGEGKTPIVLKHPTAIQVEELMRKNLVGFNCRRYDNHILHACQRGYNEEQLYNLSQRIINGEKNALNSEAYNVSFTDIYDFSSKKQSLKKFEIELGIHHQEMEIPWDEPVPDDKIDKVVEYCINDVLATEAVWNARQSDWTARQILADIANMSVNDTTNSLTTRIIFGYERKPQSQFNYRNMGDEKEVKGALANNNYGYTDWFMKKYPNLSKAVREHTLFNRQGKPLFPGYVFDRGKSSYWDVEEVGEGGYVYSEPGMYGDVGLDDIASMHPHSTLAEELFGEYTQNFRDLVNARIYIKHKDFDKASKLFGGRLAPYLKDKDKAKALSGALKIAINSVYGLTSATFTNPFKDDRNVDNIVAKRGALFMINLRHAVQDMGYTVAHIKTDSIKVPDATPEIMEFISDYGRLYGYTFEHEATYDRMCLVNDAVYIAKYATEEKCKSIYGYSPDDCTEHGGQWTATGTEFQVPYIFKTVFSKEPIEFDDMCETKAVKDGAIYLDVNEHLPDVTELEKEWKKNESDYKKGLLSDTMFMKLCDELRPQIAEGHNYHHIGKVGRFCPVIEGCGGGTLYREKDGKYFAVAGTKGYKWMEAEVVRSQGLEEFIDISYYQKMADDAIHDLIIWGNYEWFVSDEPYECPPFRGGRIPSPVYTGEMPFA